MRNAPLPVGETGGSKGMGDVPRGGSPVLHKRSAEAWGYAAGGALQRANPSPREGRSPIAIETKSGAAFTPLYGLPQASLREGSSPERAETHRGLASAIRE